MSGDRLGASANDGRPALDDRDRASRDVGLIASLSSVGSRGYAAALLAGVVGSVVAFGPGMLATVLPGAAAPVVGIAYSVLLGVVTLAYAGNAVEFVRSPITGDSPRYRISTDVFHEGFYAVVSMAPWVLVFLVAVAGWGYVLLVDPSLLGTADGKIVFAGGVVLAALVTYAMPATLGNYAVRSPNVERDVRQDLLRGLKVTKPIVHSPGNPDLYVVVFGIVPALKLAVSRTYLVGFAAIAGSGLVAGGLVAGVGFLAERLAGLGLAAGALVVPPVLAVWTVLACRSVGWIFGRKFEDFARQVPELDVRE